MDGDISLQDLEDRLVPRLFALSSSRSQSTQHLFGSAELGLAEMSAGVRTEEEFKALLRESLAGHKA